MIGRRLAVVALLVVTHTPLLAQRTDAFSAIELGVHVIADARPDDAGAAQRYWRADLGGEATAALPFYAGDIELGLQQMHFDARAGDVPGFRARLLFLGWRDNLYASRRLSWQAGARVGIYAMRFDGDTIPSFRRNESELGLAARTGLAYGIDRGGRWRAHVTAAYQAVLVSPRLEQKILSAGLSRRFSSPSWLRGALE